MTFVQQKTTRNTKQEHLSKNVRQLVQEIILRIYLYIRVAHTNRYRSIIKIGVINKFIGMFRR